MTGYLAQGRRKRYPYYKCFQHDCSTRTKSYAAASVHDEFTHFLRETSIPHYLAMGIITELALEPRAILEGNQATSRPSPVCSRSLGSRIAAERRTPSPERPVLDLRRRPA